MDATFGIVKKMRLYSPKLGPFAITETYTNCTDRIQRGRLNERIKNLGGMPDALDCSYFPPFITFRGFYSLLSLQDIQQC